MYIHSASMPKSSIEQLNGKSSRFELERPGFESQLDLRCFLSFTNIDKQESGFHYVTTWLISKWRGIIEITSTCVCVCVCVCV